MSPVRRSRLGALALAALSIAPLLIASLLVEVAASPGVALAQTSNNDAEVNTLIESVFDSEYKQGNYVDALEKLQLASNVCQEGACSAKVRGKLLVAVGTVLAGGLDQGNDAREVFKTALKEDPNVKLLKGHDTGKIKEAWDAAQGKKATAPTAHERKKYPGNGKLVAGWRSPEAYWYYDQAKQAEASREWADCAGYASDSIAVEERLSTKFLRATCNERGGKWADAVSDYQVVANDGPASGLKESAKTSADKVTELTAKIPKIVLQPPPKTEGLTVMLDDKEVPSDKLGGEMWVDPGQHRVTATATQDGNELSFEQDVSVDEGKSETVEIKLVPKASRITDTAIMQCMTKAKTRDELAKCIGDTGEKVPINVTVSTEVAGYHDTDHVDVLSPTLSTTIESPTQGWSVNGSFLVDVVTAASTDIVATASPRWTEERYVPALGGSKKFGDVTLGLSANASIEPDYISAGAGATFAVDLRQKTITPQLGYSFSYDLSGRSGTPWSVFKRTIINNDIDLGVALTLDKSTVLTLTGNIMLENGDSSKPYRYIPLFKPEDVPNVPPGLTVDAVNEFRTNIKVLEQLPTDRQRFALAGRLAHRFTTFTLRLDERLYLDTWGLKASTTDATLPIDFGKHVRLWPHFRGHFQTGVDFWQIAYAATPSPTSPDTFQVPALRAGDRELGPLIGITGGLGGRFQFTDAFSLTFAGDAVFTRFLDTLYILQRTGFLGTLGAELDFE